MVQVTPSGLILPSGVEYSAKEAADDHGLSEVSRSVAAAGTPAVTSGSPISAQFVLWIAQMADGMTPWGTSIKQRDRELRAFFPTENMLMSALATCVARNAAASWKVTGDELTAEAAALMLSNANYGGGWEQFISQVSVDLYSQDSGAFVEFVRLEDSPESPVVMLNHLDSLRCHMTGDPFYPVIYEDVQGKFHRMPWYTVLQLLEMPSAVTPGWAGQFYRLQYCAVTRALRAAQFMRDMNIYKDEKVSGRFMRAIHLISGVRDDVVQDAITRAQMRADQNGLSRYIQPAIVGGVDPNAAIGHAQVDLATLPEGWNEKDSLEGYILSLALAFLTDYQEFAPLPGGGLGTSNQSDILHQKSQGKGPGLFQKLVLRMINQHGAIPANALFEYDEPDAEADEQDARTRNTRAEARSKDVADGVLDPIAAREIMLADGDLTQQQFDDLLTRDAERLAEEERQRQLQLEIAQANQPAPGNGGGAGDQQSTVEGEGSGRPSRGRGSNTPGDATGRRSYEDPGEEPEEWGFLGSRARGEVPFGDLINGRLHRAYSTTSDDAASLGYFDSVEQRIEVASAIGPALQVFSEALREAGLYDLLIAAEDADRIVEASTKWLKSYAHEVSAKADGDAIDPERIAYEAEVGEDIARGLGAAMRIVRARVAAAER